jgi:TolA-binding protein
MKLILTVLIALMGTLILAQKDQKIADCIAMYEKSPQKAANKLKKLIDKEGNEARFDAWDVYIEMMEDIYNKKLTEVGDSFEYFVIQQEFGRLSAARDSLQSGNVDMTDDELSYYLNQIDNDQSVLDNKAYSMYSFEYENYIYSMREASLKSKSSRADANMRNLYFNGDPDTMTADTSEIRQFTQAYENINSGKFEEGKNILDQVSVKYPNSYSVNMTYYLYYFYKENLDSSKIYLKKTIDLFPAQIEARESLAKILFSEGNTFRAKKQIEELMVLFPGQDMKGYLSEILFIEDKRLEEQRIIRPVFPNQIGMTYELAKDHWQEYQKAILKVGAFTESNGMIKENDVTKEKYLELYSWKKMLDKHREDKPEELEFAYKMEAEGLLDCYVFFSNYHIDFAFQAQEWAKSEENRERAKKFVYKYLVVQGE